MLLARRRPTGGPLVYLVSSLVGFKPTSNFSCPEAKSSFEKPPDRCFRLPNVHQNMTQNMSNANPFAMAGCTNANPDVAGFE